MTLTTEKPLIGSVHLMITQRLSAESGMNIQYVVSPAETVDFPDGYFDVITACQYFIYFDKDVIGQKLHRLLKDSGRFCKLSMIWLPAESEVAQASENIILKYNPTWTGAGFTRESWHGRMKACREYILDSCESIATRHGGIFCRKRRD